MKTTQATLQLVLIAAVAVATSSACQGRNPAIAKNDDAQIEPPPPPPPPHIRTLSKTKKLFGTMPVENRFQDPLMTFTGTGWYGFSNDFQSYATINRFVDASPTNTAFLQLPTAGNPRGATLMGQLKSSTKPIHVEVWLGRDGEDGSFDNAEADFVGLFTTGGEQASTLVADEATKTVINNRTWMRFSGDLAEGPIGWAAIVVSDTASSADARANLYIGGPVAVDVPADAGAAFVSSPKRALTDREQHLLSALQDRTRQLAPPRSSPPPALPGVPRPL